MDMVPRWMACGLLWAETRFRGIRHAEDLPRLATLLVLSTPPPAPAQAVASSCVVSASAGQLEACIPTPTNDESHINHPPAVLTI